MHCRAPQLYKTLYSSIALQLAELNDLNWAPDLSVSIGLQTAVRAELAHPTNQAVVKEEPLGELDEHKKRFLY